MRKSHPSSGPGSCCSDATRALFPMRLVLPECSVPALRPQGLLLFKSLHLNLEFLLSLLLKHANFLMLHPCSKSMLQFCLPKLPFGKGSHPITWGKTLDRVFLPTLHLRNLLCHLSSRVSPRDCEVPSSETDLMTAPLQHCVHCDTVSKPRCKYIKSSNLDRRAVFPPCIFLNATYGFKLNSLSLFCQNVGLLHLLNKK